MILRFLCPACNLPIEAGDDVPIADLRCPLCLGPIQPDRSQPGHIPPPDSLPKPLVESARFIIGWAKGFLGIVFVLALFGWGAFGSEKPVVAVGFFYAAGVCLSAAFMLGVIGNLLHLRAALEKQ